MGNRFGDNEQTELTPENDDMYEDMGAPGEGYPGESPNLQRAAYSRSRRVDESENFLEEFTDDHLSRHRDAETDLIEDEKSGDPEQGRVSAHDTHVDGHTPLNFGKNL